MQKIIVQNNLYYKLLLIALSALIGYNIYVGIIGKSIITLLPVSIQSILLALLVTKHQFSKKAIKIWVIIVFFIVQGIKIGTYIVDILLNYMRNRDDIFEPITSTGFITSMILLLLGIIIWILNEDFGELRNEINPLNEPADNT